MDRRRVASVLAVVAGLAVVATTAVAIASYAGRDPGRQRDVADLPPEPLVVRDPATGATFEVPGGSAWEVEGRRVRIYYADDAGRPAAVVRGPAVFRAGYCSARPRNSNRGFAGFTRQDFRAWTGALAGSGGTWTTGVDRDRVELADGTPARLTRTGLFVGGDGPCAAEGVEVAMVEAGGVRVVLVRDTGDDDTLPGEDVEAILTSLRPG